MGGDHHRCARAGYSDDFNNDVRTRGRAGGSGAAHAPIARDPKTHRWIYRVRASRIHPREDPALPSWWSAAGCEARRTLAGTRAGAPAASRGHQELAGLLGEAWFRNLARVLAGGRK